MDLKRSICQNLILEDANFLAFLDVYIIGYFLRKAFNYIVKCKAHNMLVYGNRETQCSVRRMRLKNNLGDTKTYFILNNSKWLKKICLLKQNSLSVIDNKER